MLTSKEFNAIFESFAESAENENEPIRKSFTAKGGKWCIATNRVANICTWYETDENGKTVKYFDYLPEY